MGDDLISQLRRSAATSASAGKSPTAPPVPEEYVAFSGKDNPLYLDIRPATPPEHSPIYQCLVDVVNDGNLGTYFILVYQFMLVTVLGRNLQDMVTPLKKRRVSFIQQYDPNKWPMPKNDKAPFIEAIEFKVQAAYGSDLLKH